MSTIKGVIAS